MFRAVLAAAATLALVADLPAAGAQARRPALALASLAPLTISGRDFGPREVVLLTYLPSAGSSRVVGARATKQGRFRAVFKLRLGRCDSFTVRASGTRGSRAVLKVERRCEKTKGPPKRAPREHD
jgi:hypothetical protein